MGWHIKIKGETIGPLTDSELRDLARKGSVNPDTLVSSDHEGWVAAHTIPGLAFRATHLSLLAPGVAKAGCILLAALVAAVVGSAISSLFGTGFFATSGGIFGALIGVFWPFLSQPKKPSARSPS
jgi:GYF domain 2